MGESFVAFLLDWQDELTRALERFEPTHRFHEERWAREAGGGGRTRVLEGGDTFERAGVNFSDVTGALPDGVERAFGVSIIVHPRSPMVPAIHANYRCMFRGDRPYYGGGTDLTPCYLFEEDARHFHRTLKAACDPFGVDRYPRFKADCDRYFYLPHRDEHRGIGGLFFDQLDAPDPALPMALAEALLPAYLPIVERRLLEPHGLREREFQLLQRGRYAEFNLVWDRGTAFGLRSNGRTESILMSLPPEVRWRHDWEPAPGSREEALRAVLRAPREWTAP